MKKSLLKIMIAITVLLSTTMNAQTKSTKTEEVKVSGNCGMCKNTIEKAANGLEGVVSANWDVDKKKIDISFDDAKTDEMAIHKAIAASGYDTEKVSADLDAYNGLAGCCQYDHEMTIHHMK